MSRTKIMIAGLIGLIGALAITTQAMAITWGQLKCMYANQNVTACHPVQSTTPGDDKNTG